MKEIVLQILHLWHKLKSYQKIGSLAVIACILSFLLIPLFKSSYVSLFSEGTSTPLEVMNTKNYLEASSIPYHEKEEGSIYISKEKLPQVRSELQKLGYQKKESSKGLDLFDTSTWIKGEKELHILEVRALIGQLEKDLTTFENIQNARVILDLGSGRNQGTSSAKASVILNLHPKSYLSSSQMAAITYHLAGAIRGLEPEMVAISDTKGHLYKGFHEEVSLAAHCKDELLDHDLKQSVDVFLEKLLGTSQVIATWTDFGQSLALSVVVNEGFFADIKMRKAFLEELESHLHTLTKSCQKPLDIKIGSVHFAKNAPKSSLIALSNLPSLGLVLTGLLALGFWFFLKKIAEEKKTKKEPPKDHEDALFRMVTKVDSKKLVDAIKNEDPSTIAFMLSYLEPKRAEKIIMALPQPIQDSVIGHLSEIDRGRNL